MPVEAIHLSAFADSLADSRAASALTPPALFELGRLGALVIDFPYFERFPLGVMRHFLKLPTATSRWGDALHHGQPVLIAKSMLARVRRLRAEGAHADAERVLALALGFVSHLAVDASLHPLVNRLARARAKRIGDHPLRQHTEVEKFQSVLFHEARNGFDFMGRVELGQHIRVHARAIHQDPLLRAAFCEGLQAALGRVPSQALLVDWARGYTQYVWLVSSIAGKTLAPEREKRALHDEVYVGSWGSFQGAYAEAVASSRLALDSAHAFATDAGSEAAFDAALPAGAIDDM
jgi:Zinc dependent phospholipase C